MDDTLQTTALVHEAYLCLVDQKQVEGSNRKHFFGVAAQMMRRILVDHARKHLLSNEVEHLQGSSVDQAAVFSRSPTTG